MSRIYDLDNMPSTDNRFSNASGDIWQHTVNNDDWEDYWYFSDGRFQLSNGNDDKYILRFICEMLHPAVRDEKSPWRKYLDKFNEILEPDGYRLISVKKISGREAYEAHEIDHVIISHSNETIYAGMKSLGEGLEYDSVKIIIPKSNAEKITHGIFYTAITRAKKKLKIYWSTEIMNEIVESFIAEEREQKSLEIIRNKLFPNF